MRKISMKSIPRHSFFIKPLEKSHGNTKHVSIYVKDSTF